MKKILALLTVMTFLVTWLNAETVAYWRFEEGVNGTQHTGDQDNWYVDSSGSTNPLSALAAGDNPYATNNIPFAVVPVTDETNLLGLSCSHSALCTCGAPGDPILPINTHVFSNGFTVECMVKYHDLNFAVAVGNDARPTGAGDPAFALKHRNQPGHPLQLAFFDGATNNHKLYSSSYIDVGIWYCVAAVCDSSNAYLYIKKPGELYQLEATETNVINGFYPSEEYWTIGRGSWGGSPDSYLNGEIDEVRISDTALPVTNFLGYSTEITFTAFTGGDLLDAGNWTNGLPQGQTAFIGTNGYYNGVSQTNRWLLNSTVTVDDGATLTLSDDLATFGSSFTVNNATINCSDNFTCDGAEMILNNGSVTTANGNWGAVDNNARITVNGGTHSSGTNSDNYAGAFGDSTNVGCGIDFVGGTVTAGSFKFQTNTVSSISGTAILKSATPETRFTDMEGKINIVSGWEGYWEVDSFTNGDWKVALTSHPNITLDGTPIDEERFETYFFVESNGKTLKYSFPTFVHYFLGGNLLDANNWTHGLPAGEEAVINSNGYYTGVTQSNPWLLWSTVTVDGGAVLSLTNDLAVLGATFVVSNATINCEDDFFVDGGNVILNEGSVTTANDDWEANERQGRITVYGGTHSSGTNSGNYVGAQGSETKIGCGIDFRGGTVIAGDFRFQINSESSIGGSAILTSATPATVIADLSGNLNFTSDWSGYWQVASFEPYDWENLLVGMSNITLDGVMIDSDTFADEFFVSEDGKTLSYMLPEPFYLLFIIYYLLFIARKKLINK